MKIHCKVIIKTVQWIERKNQLLLEQRDIKSVFIVLVLLLDETGFGEYDKHKVRNVGIE